MSQITTVPLPEETVLAGRYVLGSPRVVAEAGIAYNAFDKKLRMPCEVFEFLPIDCAVRRKNGSVASKENTDPKIFEEKCQKLRNGAVQRFQDSSSAIYDLIAANGSVYLVQASAKNYAYPGSIPPVDADAMPEEEDAVTREIGGLFAGGDHSTHEELPVSEGPTITFPSELFQDKPDVSLTENKQEQPVAKPQSHKQPSAPPKAPKPPKPETESAPKSVPKSASQPAFKATPKPAVKPKIYEDDTEDNKKLNIKLLSILLAGVVILLILGIIIFVNVLQQISGTIDDSESLLGIPVVDLAKDNDTEYLIAGIGNNPQYAPGMVIAEEKKGDVMHILVNGVFPSYVMPDLVGMAYESAEVLLNRTPYCNTAGNVTVKVQIEEVNSAVYPAGAVVSQSPAADSVVSSDTPVVLKIASGSADAVSDVEIPMPDLGGKKYAPVVSGHPLVINDRIYSCDIPAGTIIHQYPSTGETWVEGGVCYVVVSAGEEMTYVPDVLYCTLEQAKETLYAKGLSVNTEYAYYANVKEGLVAKQSLDSGSETAYGNTVTLTISGDGKEHSGPTIENSVKEVTLKVGDTCTMALGTKHSVLYCSFNPASVTVNDEGIITAVAPGSAVVTATADGTTISMTIAVEYPEEKTISGIAQIDKAFSLSTLLEDRKESLQWRILQGEGSLSEKGVFQTQTAGKVILGSTSGSDPILVLLNVENIGFVSIAKDLLKDVDSAKKLLEDNGLTCLVEKEYSADHEEGTVLRIQYSGDSDDKAYHFAAGSTVTLIVSSGEPRVSSIAILSKPDKLTYKIGETLDTAGLVLSVTYEDGTVKEITSGFTTSYDFSAAGRKTVAVSYGERKASFHVEVVGQSPAKLSIVSMPDKTTYFIGEALDTTGLEVQITYGDGRTQSFSSGFMTAHNFGKAGTAEVTVTIEGFSATFTVTVLEKKVEYLELLKYPNKVSYYEGEAFDGEGMQLRAYYGDDSMDIITDGWTVTVDMTAMVGECPVTVSYGGKSVNFIINIRGAELQSVELEKLPTKTKYMQGEEIDLTGLVLKETYANGKTETVSWPNSSITCTYDFSTAGDKWVTVKYLDQECRFNVEVKAVKLLKLSVQSMPDKTVYMPGDKFDTTGLVLLAEYENDIQKQITSGYTYSYDFSESGDAKVTVFFGDLETAFYVSVVKDELLYTDPASLEMQVGETQTVRIYCQLASQSISVTVSDSSVISVKAMGNALVITALDAGESTILLQNGTVTTECKVTVNDDQFPGSFTASLPTTDTKELYFEKSLVLTGSASKDIVVNFSAIVSYDPGVIVLADYRGTYDGITVQYDGESSAILSGKITIPKGETVTAATFVFLGTDTSACALSIK